jgi:transcriptional regulator with XRE-family HTH domain
LSYGADLAAIAGTSVRTSGISIPPCGDHGAMTSNPSLGTAIRQRREARGLSMKELEKQSGVSRSTLHRVEHDLMRPIPYKLAQILAVLENDAEALVAVADRDYRAQVAKWRDRLRAVDSKPLGAQPSAELVAVHPDDTVARIQVHAGRRDELAAILGAAGWAVSR